jgi:5-methylcytosine-specific restriction endonuclease McrA
MTDDVKYIRPANYPWLLSVGQAPDPFAHLSPKENKKRLDGDRQLRLLQATPSWADKDAIKAIYKQAQEKSLDSLLEMGWKHIKYEVDHIIPLQGKNVCGLHIAENLRVIEKARNHKKYNLYDPSEGEEVVREVISGTNG